MLPEYASYLFYYVPREIFSRASIHTDITQGLRFTCCTLGPREPWHDIHCRMEGPAAWDILSNFEQRWQKQGKDVSVLLNMAQVPGLAYGATAERDDGVPAVMVTPPGSPEEWRVQVKPWRPAALSLSSHLCVLATWVAGGVQGALL